MGQRVPEVTGPDVGDVEEDALQFVESARITCSPAVRAVCRLEQVFFEQISDMCARLRLSRFPIAGLGCDVGKFRYRRISDC